jgi:hypothetical protein
MKRITTALAALAVLTFIPAHLGADVKTRQKDSMKFEGMMGRVMSMAGVGGDPATSTVSVKGTRMASIGDRAGQIIDLAEERVYQLDMRRKEYTVVTFAEMRRQMEEMRERLAQQTTQAGEADRPAGRDASQDVEIDVNVQETGERKSIAGHDTRQVVLTLTLRQKGKTLEEGGGIVMTNDLWIAPAIAALDEVAAFQVKYAQAVFGAAVAVDPRQASGISALIPAFGSLAARLAEEGRKLQGTTLVSTTVIETVKSEADMKAAAEQSGGGGGIGGALAGRLLRRGSQQPRSKSMTMTHEVLSVDTTVTADDVQLPAGFKEKK